MNCRAVRSSIPGYLEGTLSDAQQQEVEEHLLGCPACCQCVEAADGATPAPVPAAPEYPAGFWEQMDDALAVEVARSPSLGGRVAAWLRAPVKVSRGTLVLWTALFLVALAWGFRRPDPGGAGQLLPFDEVLAVPAPAPSDGDLETVSYRPVLQLF